MKSLRSTTSLDDKAASVQGAITAVHDVSEELLHKSLNEVKDLNKVQLATIRQLREDILEELRALEGRKTSVNKEFNVNYIPGIGFEERLAKVEGDAIFSNWLDSPRSRMLVLAGRNYVAAAAHCWLSPIAIRLIQKLSRSSPPELYAFLILGERRADDTFDHTLSTLVYRLLSQHSEGLRNKAAYDLLLKAIEDYRVVRANEPGNRRKVHHALKNVVLRALNTLEPGRTVWVVLDRVDQCRCATETKISHRMALLKSLLSLVEDKETRVKLRVLAVVNDLAWDVERKMTSKILRRIV
ncbi:hypothetical protein PG999_003029 [Apiospora kogelbergensis]|uniref:Nephrocystin 3-like N-terminal domain-containing protein n=1 Tax=Apiospora kogelbergensis TaxID=1337665 RepID=A0AAW0R9U3_9PEZI